MVVLVAISLIVDEMPLRDQSGLQVHAGWLCVEEQLREALPSMADSPAQSAMPSLQIIGRPDWRLEH